MTKLPRISLLIALLAIPFASISKAQLMTATYDGSYDYSAGYAAGTVFGEDEGISQTFVGVFTSIDTVTFRFITNNLSVLPQTLDVYFSEWSGINATSSLGVGTFDLPATASWTADAVGGHYDMAFDLTSVAGSLTPGTTYGLTVVGNLDTEFGGIKVGNGPIGYAGGAGVTHAGPVTEFSNLTSSGVAYGGNYAFIADSSPGYDAFAPVPEASTVAVIFAGAFVSLMVGVRIRQRRLQAALVEA